VLVLGPVLVQAPGPVLAQVEHKLIPSLLTKL
jgi:hypothetical protein